jgi:diguanylate cyclase (GGDEF)-like protein
MTELLLLLAEVVVYFTALAALFRARRVLGIGAFICALGAFHFFETYLAATLYVRVPFDIVLSPGSSVLFVGKLFMLLLLYIREDAVAVRQPIYGLLLANLIIVALTAMMRQHAVIAPIGGELPDYKLMQEMGGLMVWGTTLLFVDCILIVLLYERLAALRSRPALRIFLGAAAVLTFDQVGFYLALRVLFEAPLDVLAGGWVAKMASAAVFSTLCGLYLRLFEQEGRARPRRRLWDVFDILTYRERYETLLKESFQDSLTGLPDRRAFDREGPTLVAATLLLRRPVSVLVVDIDHFKAVNDRFGHTAGDLVLRGVAAKIRACAPSAQTRCFRFGGDEFVVVCENLAHDAALRWAERLRWEITDDELVIGGQPVTVSIGVATGPPDGRDLQTLFDCADRRLYEAKGAGRDRTIGADPVQPAAVGL